eukprot:gnl/MRDRNA2_/MRDRNA2_86102_c0_seq3.p1 gnl/MRDRNA2_/MRDRNA2_86102_c0~~gnl/MRDRNA2_/MRDRNA2_86102_c0_seq3.p1  ORF type:complete len:108 (-),score=3.68 gnl/MRDRNA2_/MRDRNA2_86102_c0_seq3:313-636(-)
MFRCKLQEIHQTDNPTTQKSNEDALSPRVALTHFNRPPRIEPDPQQKAATTYWNHLECQTRELRCYGKMPCSTSYAYRHVAEKRERPAYHYPLPAHLMARTRAGFQP